MSRLLHFIYFLFVLSFISTSAMHRSASVAPRLMTFSSTSKVFIKSPLHAHRLIPMRLGHVSKQTNQPKFLFNSINVKKEDQDNDQRQKFNWNRAKNAGVLLGTGATLAVLYAQAAKSEGQEKEQQALEQYKSPFEKQRKKYYEQLLAKPWGNVSREYIFMLEKTEKEYMDVFLQIIGKTEKEWNHFKNNLITHFQSTKDDNWEVLHKQYSIDKKLLLDELPERIEFLFTQHGLHNDIKLVIDPNANEGLMVAYPYVIIGELFFKSHAIWQNADAKKLITAESIDAVFLHEMQHLLHEEIAIQFMRNEFPQHKSFFNKFSKFQEMRADILSGLTNPAVALGAANFFQARTLHERPKNMPAGFVWAELPSPHHPPRDMRIQYLTSMHQEMLDAIEKNKQKTT